MYPLVMCDTFWFLWLRLADRLIALHDGLFGDVPFVLDKVSLVL